MSQLDGKARQLVHSVQPRDMRAGGVDGDVRMKSASIAFGLLKMADVTGALRKAEQAIRGVTKVQHQSLTKQLQEMKSQLEDAKTQNQTIQQQMGEQGQMMEGMMAPGPKPPPAQPPYGDMLRAQMATQEEQKKK